MEGEWSVELKNFGLIRISQDFIKRISNYRQLNEGVPESGGVLLGGFLNTGGALLIHDFTPPQKTDKQGRCLYFRSEMHNKLVQEIWEESNNHITYVGLWHTHPEPVPNYSHIDKRDWVNSLKNSHYDGKQLFFFIIGQTHIRCWIGINRRFNSSFNLIGEYEFVK
jgi:integrative and conjugative element protein (TIGR02256 family)